MWTEARHCRDGAKRRGAHRGGRARSALLNAMSVLLKEESRGEL